MLVSQCLTICKPMDCSLSGSSVHGIFKARILEWVAVSWSGQLFPSPGDLPNPGFEPRSPALQADSLPAEPPQKTQKYWNGQPIPSPGIFPTQKLNWHFLLHRHILYQLGSQGSPSSYILKLIKILLLSHSINISLYTHISYFHCFLFLPLFLNLHFH